jgi:hypothetical protein
VLSESSKLDFSFNGVPQADANYVNDACCFPLNFAWAELRRAGDVSPLILRVADNQGIDIPRSQIKQCHQHLADALPFISSSGDY